MLPPDLWVTEDRTGAHLSCFSLHQEKIWSFDASLCFSAQLFLSKRFDMHRWVDNDFHGGTDEIYPRRSALGVSGTCSRWRSVVAFVVVLSCHCCHAVVARITDLSSRRVPTFQLPDIFFIFLGTRHCITFWLPGPLWPGGLSPLVVNIAHVGVIA